MTISPEPGEDAAIRSISERDRFAQIVGIFGRHGLRGLASRLGLGDGRDTELEDARLEAVVAALRELGRSGEVRPDTGHAERSARA